MKIYFKKRESAKKKKKKNGKIRWWNISLNLKKD